MDKNISHGDKVVDGNFAVFYYPSLSLYFCFAWMLQFFRWDLSLNEDDYSRSHLEWSTTRRDAWWIVLPARAWFADHLPIS